MSRTWRSKQENTVDPPSGGYENYRSYQKIINSNNGQIDEELLEEHIRMILYNHWEELPLDFDLLEKGDQIRYTTFVNDQANGPRKHLFRTGGWVTAIDEENDPPEWFSYMSHTKSSWCVQLKDIQRLFVRRRPKFTKADEMFVKKAYFNRPGPPTRHNVYLPDENGVLRLVYSARDEYSKQRFESSRKYHNALKVGWEFKD